MHEIKEACVKYKYAVTGQRRNRTQSLDDKVTPSEVAQSIDIVYIDKNNTPDIWQTNSKMLKNIADEEIGKSVIKTVLLLPS